MSRFAFVVTLVVSTNAMASNDSAIAVLDIQGTGVPAELLPTLTEVLTVEIAEIGLYKVIAGRDIQSMLGFERQKDVLGCTDAACLAEIGGALGVDRIVASHIGMVGSTYVVNIKLINIRMANTEGRAYETVRGESDALIATVKKSARKLLGPGSKAAIARGDTTSPAISASDDAAADASTAAAANPSAARRTRATAAADDAKPTARAPVAVADTPPAVTASPEHKHSIGIMPWVFWGAGAVALGVGAATGISAKGEAGRANNTQEPGSQVAAVNAPQMAQRATILLGVGAVLVAGGFAWMWLASDSSPPTTAFAPVLTQGGLGVAATTRF